MGFYNSKLNTYSKFVKFNKKTMAEAQRNIIASREKSLEQAKEDLRVARRYHIENFSGASEEDILLKEKEIGFLKTLDVVDFFQHLINVENYNLVQMLNESAKKKNEYDAVIEKSVNSKSLIPAGIINRRIEKFTRLSKKEDLTVGCSVEAMTEWKGLIPDDQVIYLVGRYEIEGKAEFDSKGFEEYKEAIYKLQHLKDENSSEVQPGEKE